jgi:hypothetical protein
VNQNLGAGGGDGVGTEIAAESGEREYLRVWGGRINFIRRGRKRTELTIKRTVRHDAIKTFFSFAKIQKRDLK